MTQQLKIAIVSSEFNSAVTGKLLAGAIEELSAAGIAADAIATTSVPGAVELPLMAKQFALCGQYNAIICLGCVIRGETDHYTYVCQQASYGCQQVALQYSIPVIFGVLTTDNQEQALARAGGNHSNKGQECAKAALQMIETMQAEVWPPRRSAQIDGEKIDGHCV